MTGRRRIVARVRALPAADWLLLGRAFCSLVVAKVALKIVPVKRILGWQQRGFRAGVVGPEASGRVLSRVRWAVLAVARRSPVPFVCFPQCLAASALLRGYGIRSRLHYGVRRGEGGALETHTWLEAGGQTVIGGEVAGWFSELALREQGRVLTDSGGRTADSLRE